MASVSAGNIIQTELVDRGLCLSQSHYTDRVGRLWPLSQPVKLYRQSWKTVASVSAGHDIQTELGDWPLSQTVTLYRQSWKTVTSVSAGHDIQTDLGDRGLCLSRSHYTDRVGRAWSLSQPVILYRQT